MQTTVEQIVGRVNELAVLPVVVYKVVELSSSAQSTAGDLERTISIDPGFTSRLLTAANSAFYALPRKVASIRDAIMFLGFKQIRQLAMTVGMYDMFVGKTDRGSLRRRAWWRRSVDTAVCCAWLGRETRKSPPDDAYTCGLLHLIGKTLLDRFGNAPYDQVEEEIARGISDLDAERGVYGCDHIELGVAAAQKWGFPEPLLEGLKYDTPAEPDDPNGPLRACVAVSSKIAGWAQDNGLSSAETERILPEWALAFLELPYERQGEIVEGGRQAIAAAASMQL